MSRPPNGGRRRASRRLLAAVITIAGRQGQHAVTYRSVADEANVSHGLVRHYFGTRQAMIAEAFECAIGEDIAYEIPETSAFTHNVVCLGGSHGVASRGPQSIGS